PHHQRREVQPSGWNRPHRGAAGHGPHRDRRRRQRHRNGRKRARDRRDPLRPGGLALEPAAGRHRSRPAARDRPRRAARRRAQDREPEGRGHDGPRDLPRGADGGTAERRMPARGRAGAALSTLKEELGVSAGPDRRSFGLAALMAVAAAAGPLIVAALRFVEPDAFPSPLLALAAAAALLLAPGIAALAVAVHGLPTVSARFAARPDSEHEQIMIRVGMGVAVLAYTFGLLAVDSVDEAGLADAFLVAAVGQS